MTAAFGEPTYDDAPHQDPAAGSAPPDPSAPVVDPNDPQLTSEVITINPAADAYAILPTLPDGKWRAKAKQLDIKDDRGQMQRYAALSRPKMENGKRFFATNIEFSVIDYSGEFDGYKLSEYWVRTLVDSRKGTSSAATMTAKLGGKVVVTGTQLDTINALLTVLAAEPELILETAWSAECQTCQEAAKKRGDRTPRPFVQGMHRFPTTRTPGVHDPMVQCPTCKNQVKAQARIVGFYSIAEAKPTRGMGKQVLGASGASAAPAAK